MFFLIRRVTRWVTAITAVVIAIRQLKAVYDSFRRDKQRRKRQQQEQDAYAGA